MGASGWGQARAGREGQSKSFVSAHNISVFPFGAWAPDDGRKQQAFPTFMELSEPSHWKGLPGTSHRLGVLKDAVVGMRRPTLEDIKEHLSSPKPGRGGGKASTVPPWMPHV